MQIDYDFQMMRILEQREDITQRELASELGLSLGKVNYCLKALTDKGWVKMKNFSKSKKKLGYIYVLTPEGIAQRTKMTGDFLQRKMQEFDALQLEIETLKREIHENGL